MTEGTQLIIVGVEASHESSGDIPQLSGMGWSSRTLDAESMPNHTSTHDHTTRCWWDHERASWDCPAGLDEPPLVDVRDMIVVHGALLREFRLLAAAIAALPTDATRRRKAALDHLDHVCGLLHHHHEGEDALLWPLLRDRVGSAGRSAIDEAEAQHAHIDACLQAVVAGRKSWADDPAAARRDALASDLNTLHAVLADHLEFEERRLLPLAAATFSEPEWHAIGEAAVAATPKPVLPLTFGMFAYEGDPTVLRDMLRSAPLVPRLLLPHLAPRVYARRATRVYGTARP